MNRTRTCRPRSVPEPWRGTPPRRSSPATTRTTPPDFGRTRVKHILIPVSIFRSSQKPQQQQKSRFFPPQIAAVTDPKSHRRGVAFHGNRPTTPAGQVCRRKKNRRRCVLFILALCLFYGLMGKSIIINITSASTRGDARPPDWDRWNWRNFFGGVFTDSLSVFVPHSWARYFFFLLFWRFAQKKNKPKRKWRNDAPFECEGQVAVPKLQFKWRDDSRECRRRREGRFCMLLSHFWTVLATPPGLVPPPEARRKSAIISVWRGGFLMIIVRR